MLGLEKAYYELDSVRNRVIRLVQMERLDKTVGDKITKKTLELQQYIGDILEKEGGNGSEGREDKDRSGIT